MNTMKTFVLMLVLSMLLLILGWFLGGFVGIIVALVISFLMNFFAYWFSDKIALAMSHAHEVSPQEEPVLHAIVDEQAQKAGISKPRVYIIETDSPNAFATGRSPKHAAIAVTTGIMRILSRDELSGVIAHELAHVGNRDTLIMTVAATIAGAIAMIATMLQWSAMFGGMFGGRDNERGGYSQLVSLLALVFIAIFMSIAATLIKLAISRAREYQADATGARTSGTPWALADALEKLEAGSRRRPMKVNPSVSHLFIVNPLSGESLLHLFSTHPPIPERVRRLREMVTRPGW